MQELRSVFLSLSLFLFQAYELLIAKVKLVKCVSPGKYRKLQFSSHVLMASLAPKKEEIPTFFYISQP